VGCEGLKTTSIVDSPNPSDKIPLLIPGIRFLPLPDGQIRIHNKKNLHQFWYPMQGVRCYRKLYWNGKWS
jgi:hypothetical protein